MRRITTMVAVGVGLVFFHEPARMLILAAWNDSLYSHLFFIPIVCAYLLWARRSSVFSNLNFAPVAGGIVLLLGAFVVLLQVVWGHDLNQNDQLFFQATGIVIYLWGVFILICGLRVFRRALFPMMFLLFMIPVPSVILEPVVRFLQVGSAYAAQGLLKIIGVPVYSEGVHITLPGVTVEVAKQCSGVRAALALFIIGTVAGYLYLNSNRRRLLLVLAVIPITIIKNGMRIMTLALLGAYVDMSFLTHSRLHSEGGKPFLLVAIAMMVPILWLLVRNERKREKVVVSDKNRIGRPDEPVASPGLALADRSITAR